MTQFLQTIRFRIIAAFAVVTLALVGNALYGMRAVKTMSENMQTAYTGNLIPVTQLALFRIHEIEIRRLLWQTLVTQDKDNLRRVRELLAAMESCWAQYYSAGISSVDEQAIADRIHAEASTFKSMIDQEVAQIEKGDVAGAIELQRNSVVRVAEALNSLIQQDMDLNQAQARDFTRDSERSSKQMFWIALGMLAASALVCLGATVYLSKAITRPLKRSVDIANDIADGRLDRPITVDAKGEFGSLLDAMKRMSGQLADTVCRIKTSSDSVTVASREIAAGNMELAETVKQNADNARQANSRGRRSGARGGAGARLRRRRGRGALARATVVFRCEGNQGPDRIVDDARRGRFAPGRRSRRDDGPGDARDQAGVGYRR
ncbi:hypothetical protein CBA19C8_23710 [Paraburkholderia terrae]|nr:hypothetical protein CBA19C8_23710 [Paraburkholderia terrae]